MEEATRVGGIARVGGRGLNRDCCRVGRRSKLGVLICPGGGCTSSCTVFNAHCNSVSARFGLSNRGRFARMPRNVTRFLRRGLFRDRSLSTFRHCTTANTDTGTCADFSGAYCLFSYSNSFGNSLRVLLSFMARPCFAPRAIRGRRNVVNRRVGVYRSRPS